MFSANIFELTFVCQHICKSPLVMGGIQIIAVGDVYQLRPVPSPSTGVARKDAF